MRNYRLKSPANLWSEFSIVIKLGKVLGNEDPQRDVHAGIHICAAMEVGRGRVARPTQAAFIPGNPRYSF